MLSSVHIAVSLVIPSGVMTDNNPGLQVEFDSIVRIRRDLAKENGFSAKYSPSDVPQRLKAKRRSSIFISDSETSKEN